MKEHCTNKPFPWNHKRRFNAYPEYFKKLSGSRVQKVAVHAGLTCPNRDGTLGYGGCTYCNNEAFNPSYCSPDLGITEQINTGIRFHKFRYRRAKKYLAYFQPYTNTYCDLPKFMKMCGEALSHPGIAGLVIGTRPDCVSEDILNYLAELAEHCYIIVEYGIESCYDRTLKRVNRGHTFKQSVAAIEKTVKKGIRTGAHLIFGLPGETCEDMLRQATILSSLPLGNIKFHQLQIFKGTKIAEEYKRNPGEFHLFKMEEYIEFVIDFLELLNPAFVVERFTGETPPRFLVTPSWKLRRSEELLRMTEQRMEERDTWQGKFFAGSNAIEK
ncbi:MAG: TIGR01212 family radical SAM protein [Bacteroidetes bacterium]|nr:TIGR01212 family radical SAM protein [Bacteroidota bacterium]